jgi:hypothetical protein
MQPRWFKPLKRKPRSFAVLGFDVEGSGKEGGFVCGSIVGEFVSHFFTDRGDMWKALLYYASEGYWLFALNLEYDLPIVAGLNFWEGDMLFTEGGILWADFHVKEKRARFYDAANLFPRFSADKLGGMVGIPKLVVDPRLKLRMAKAEAWTSFSPEDQYMIERYNLRDSEIVYKAVDNLQDLARYLGGELHATLAGVSMDIYRRAYHRFPWLALGEETNRLARPAFYGGRVEPFRVGVVPGVSLYDITSLYPFAQRETRFPHPNHLKMLLYPPLSGSWLLWEGVASVRIEVPDHFIPPLPARIESRLFFPTGELSGVWTIREIVYSILQGCRLISVDWVLGSEIVFNPFERFVDQLFALRQAYLIDNPVRANLVKLILNSLYGRFGLNPDSPLTKMVPILEDTDLDTLQGFRTRELAGYLVAYGEVKTARLPAYVNALFAAQVTAEGRIMLQEGLQQAGQDAVYCDTDSVMTTGQIPTGDGLGDFRLVAGPLRADLIGPKEYELEDIYANTRSVVKGIPEALAHEYMVRGFARFSRALSVREAYNSGGQPAEWVETFKGRGSAVPKRAVLTSPLEADPGFQFTRPWAISEIEALDLSPLRAGAGRSSQSRARVLPVSLQVQRPPFGVDW